MVFLFPGVLFRRFYYTGRFSRQFNQGNLLERFLWTLFCGFICLTIFGLFFYFLNTSCGFNILHNITFDSICNIFYSLGTNDYPIEFTEEDKLIDFGILIISTYIFSGFSGTFCHYIVQIFKLDINISTLKFNNDWLYLTEANKLNGIKRKRFDNYLTYFDVLTHHKEKEELYRGIFKDFIFDKDNKLENIILSDVQKFISLTKEDNNVKKIESLKSESIRNPELYTKHSEFQDKIVFKKSIEGHFLVLPVENILNLNVTYVNYFNRHSKIPLLRFSYFILFILFGGLFLFPFFQNDSPYFATFGKRLAFSAVTFLELIYLFGIWRHILRSSPNLLKETLECILLTLWFGIFYLSIFNIINIVVTVFLFIGGLFIVGLSLKQINKLKKAEDINN